ncbi:MAG: ABC transporter permease subunit [Alphaproteobacteria bacterium]|nr:ABC transporter permease subunit [Alphaproteobacteria bacterium]
MGPVLYVIVYSFNASDRLTVWGGFSVRHYLQLPHETRFLESFFNSLLIATLAGLIAVLLGTIAAWYLQRRKRFRLLLGFLTTAPLVMPEVITGVSLLLLFILSEQLLGFPSERGLITIIVSHTTFAVAFVTLVVGARLHAMDRSCEEAAADLGASKSRTIIAVVIPQLIPALVTGWLLAFVLSFDDLIIATFTSGAGTTTLPMQVFSSIRLGFSPHINALSTLLLVAILILIAGYRWAQRRFFTS